MKALFFVLAIFASSVALADSFSYVDSAGVRLRLFNAPCAVPEASPQFVKHGVPLQIAITAKAAEIVNGAKIIPACYLVHPQGLVYAVAPALGGGIITLPVDFFMPEKQV